MAFFFTTGENNTDLSLQNITFTIINQTAPFVHFPE